MTYSKDNKILLLAFYCDKSLGIRYIGKYLKDKGYDVTLCFIKTSPTDPSPITDAELNLLEELIKKESYLYIGLSILTSYTLSEVYKVNNMIRANFNIPIIWGGIYPTLFPEKCIDKCDIVVRGEGEIPMLKIADAIKGGKDWKNISNISYCGENGEYINNELAPLVEDLDLISYPLIGNDNMYLIEGNKIEQGDPQLNNYFCFNIESYEISTSRGCPFSCSYCSSSKIKEIYRGKGKYNRFRSVDNVIKELKEAIKKNPNIKEIRFWDEVFATNKQWLKEFSEKYKKEIGLRFVIWGHPLFSKKEDIEKLVDAGLRRIIVGIQSGSPNVRNNIFKRPETNEQIIEASKILSSFPQLEVYYDLIICHILESVTELKETFDLCLNLQAPFGLQIHGLSFLPKTDIIQTLIEKELYTEEELEEIFNAPFEENYKQWNGPAENFYAENTEKKVWADLIFLSQFPIIRSSILKLSKKPQKNSNKISKLKTTIESFSKEKQEELKQPSNNYIKNLYNNLKISFIMLRKK